MELLFTSAVGKELKRLKLKQPKLAGKIQSRLKVFREDPKYPALRLHKLKGQFNDSWSISIEGNYRMLYYIKDGKAVFFDTGTHDQVYKK